MISTLFRPEDHDATGFDSGQASLDRWLREHAASAARRNLTRVFVWEDDGVVVGYYALSAHQVNRSLLPSRVGRGGPDLVPAVLLGRLALDRSLQGQGLGAELLFDAMSRVEMAATQVGIRLVVVDAIDAHAAAFYTHHGFAPLIDARLFRRLSDLVKDLAER